MEKYLILGHAGHGKDTFASTHAKENELTYSSTSYLIGKEAVYPHMIGYYSSYSDCFKDRANKRKVWFDLINSYNKQNPGKLVEYVLEHSNYYVGMRDIGEVEKCAHLFTKIFYIDSYPRVQWESKESMNFKYEDVKKFNAIRIDNN